MREVSRQEDRLQVRTQAWALTVSILWMVLCQVACVALWDAGLASQQGALVQWLIVGVLPPALSLWRLEQAPR